MNHYSIQIRALLITSIFALALAVSSAFGQSETDTISREISVFNDLTNPVFANDVISREISVFHDLTNPVDITDAVSREISLYKYQQRISSSGAAAGLQITGALPDQLSALNAGPPPYNPLTWFSVHRKSTDAAILFRCDQVSDPLAIGYVLATTYLPDADEVTLDNCSSAFYRFTFSLPAGAANARLSLRINCDDQGIAFLNGNQVSGTMSVPPCEPTAGQNDPCYSAQDFNHDRVDAQGRTILTGPTLDTILVTTSAFFQIGVNELVIGVSGNSGYFEPTGVEFDGLLEYGYGSVSCATTISNQPVNVHVCPGQSASFVVNASSGGTLMYQWRKDGVALEDSATISGSQSETLLVQNTGSANIGMYDCVVATECDLEVSTAANLTLRAPVMIEAQPANLTVAPGNTAILSLSAGGDIPISYQWRKNSQPLFDGGAISGAGTANLQIDPVSMADAGQYDVIASNACGSVGSAAATLTVPSQQISRFVICDAGAFVVGTQHSLRGTLGQAVAGSGSGTTHSIHAGFWHPLSVPEVTGDLNCDQVLDVADISALVVALLDPAAYSSQFPGCDINRADLNDNGTADGQDIQSFVTCLISGCP